MTAKKFAICDHKHYAILNMQDELQAKETGYPIYSLTKNELIESYLGSNSLKFINAWDFSFRIVPQGTNKKDALEAIENLYKE
jgi:hypothetical protein